MTTAGARNVELAGGNEPLNILQDALKTKTGIADAPLGTSDIFKQAGVGGYGALSAALMGRKQEMAINMRDYQDALSKMAGTYSDMSKKALTNYSQAVEAYNTEVDRLQKIEDVARGYEQEVSLLKIKHEMDKELKGLSGDGTSLTEKEMADMAMDLVSNDPINYPTLASALAEVRKTFGSQTIDPTTIPGGSEQGAIHMRNETIAPQCAQYTNDLAGTRFGDSLENKISQTDKSITRGRVGDTIVTNEGGDKYGHVAIITGYDGNNYILSESNYRKNDEGVGIVTHDRRLPMDSVNIKGFTPTKLTKDNSILTERLTKGVGQADYFKAPETVKTKQDALDMLGFGTPGLTEGLETGTQEDAKPTIDVETLKEEFNKKVINLSSEGKMKTAKQQFAKYLRDGELELAKDYVDSLVTGEGKQLSGPQVNLVTEGQVIQNVTKPLYKILSDNKDVFGPIVGYLGQVNQYNEKAQIIDADLRIASQTIGRYLEGGVLRKEDEEKYRKMLPQLTDTPGVAEAKLKSVDSLLKQKQMQTIQNLAISGYDVSGYVADATGNASFSTDNDFYSLSEADTAPMGSIIVLDNGKEVVKIGDNQYSDL
jgi:hypothetical protein